MTEQPLLPPPDGAREPIIIGPKPQPQSRPVLPVLCALGFLILAGAIYYVWQNPNVPSELTSAAANQAAAIRGAEQRLGDTDTHLGKLDGRIGDLDGRLTRLEQRPTADLSKVTARMDSLDAKLADQAQFASRLDTVSGRIESLSARDQTALDANKRQLDALAGRVAAQEGNAGTLATLTKRLARVSRLQEASFALANGRPLGELPDAPAALARYAHAAPPTEAQLRLDFAQAEQAALDAPPPGASATPFLDRAWERAQNLVTVRQGGAVVVGNSSSTALNLAKAALDAGDIAGAVKSVETLKAQPKEAMAGWVTEAKGLLDARAALADMADQA